MIRVYANSCKLFARVHSDWLTTCQWLTRNQHCKTQLTNTTTVWTIHRENAIKIWWWLNLAGEKLYYFSGFLRLNQNSLDFKSKLITVVQYWVEHCYVPIAFPKGPMKVNKILKVLELRVNLSRHRLTNVYVQ